LRNSNQESCHFI